MAVVGLTWSEMDSTCRSSSCDARPDERLRPWPFQAVPALGAVPSPDHGARRGSQRPWLTACRWRASV